ncbi:MAG: LptE family protein [Bacteroidales bacterium]
MIKIIFNHKQSALSAFHSLISYRFFLIAFFILSAFTACKVNYSFTGGSIDPKIKTISIQYFPNNASIIQPTLSQAFTEALRDKFSSQTKLTLVNKGGDLNIDGSITGYLTQPVAIQGDETAALNRLTITVNVKFSNKSDEKQNFEQTFSRFEDFQSSQSLSSVEETLINDINEALVEDIFNKAVVNW